MYVNSPRTLFLLDWLFHQTVKSYPGLMEKSQGILFRSYFSAFFPVRLVTHHYAITKSPRCFE